VGALSGDPEDIRKTDAKMKELFPQNKPLHRWLDMAEQRISYQGLPARICWIGLGERHLAGLAFNEMVKSGELKAPIVIGRDHLDSGSVASPNRETESMKDGSDAVSDWPLLNALLNTASGATWVSLHHGGGVGMGYSQHAGVVIVCDGTASRGQDRAGAFQRSRRRRDAPRRCGLRDRRRVSAREQTQAADVGMSVPGKEIIVPGQLALAQLRRLCGSERVIVELAPACLAGVRASAELVRQATEGDAPVYGVNTGFGKLANTRIARDDLALLQLKLLRSHAVGVGEPMPEPVVRLILLLKAASLARGFSGVREEVIDTLLALHNKGLTPVIPARVRWVPRVIWRHWRIYPFRWLVKAKFSIRANACPQPMLSNARAFSRSSSRPRKAWR
jgi:hypothetical protein